MKPLKGIVMTHKQPLLGLRRGIDIIRLLASSSEGIPFNRLRSLCGLPAPTLSRVLKALVEERMVEKGATYKLGRGFMDIAHTALGSISREEIIQPILDRLGIMTGESAGYFELEDTAIVIKAKSEQGQSWHYSDIGKRNERITRNGFGQVCIACISEKKQRQILKKASESPVISRQQFIKRMDNILKKGIYFEQGEAAPAVQRFVAPVFQGEAILAGAIGITMLKHPLKAAEKKEFCAQVQQAAADASRLLSRYTCNQENINE
jgi:IclR family acetate operon transcriptional repressor